MGPPQSPRRSQRQSVDRGRRHPTQSHPPAPRQAGPGQRRPDRHLPAQQEAPPQLPDRPRQRLAHRYRHHRRRLPTPLQRPHGHHRRPLEPQRSRSRPPNYAPSDPTATSTTELNHFDPDASPARALSWASDVLPTNSSLSPPEELVERNAPPLPVATAEHASPIVTGDSVRLAQATTGTGVKPLAPSNPQPRGGTDSHPRRNLMTTGNPAGRQWARTHGR